MRSKLKRTVLFGCGLFLLGGVGSGIIIYYFYSEILLANFLFPCSEKHIWIRDTAKGSKGETFDDFLDLSELAKQVRKGNNNYKVILNQRHLLNLQRLFNGKVYNLIFENDDFSKTTKFKFSGGLSGENESCSTPDNLILENAYQFINDLPLSELQKKKLRDNVGVLSPISLSRG